MIGAYNEELLERAINKPVVVYRRDIKNWDSYDKDRMVEVVGRIKERSSILPYLQSFPDDSWGKYVFGDEEMIVMKNPEGRIRVLYRKGKLKDLSLYPRVIGDTSIKEGNYNVENAVGKHRRVINKGVSRGV